MLQPCRYITTCNKHTINFVGENTFLRCLSDLSEIRSRWNVPALKYKSPAKAGHLERVPCNIHNSEFPWSNPRGREMERLSAAALSLLYYYCYLMSGRYRIAFYGRMYLGSYPGSYKRVFVDRSQKEKPYYHIVLFFFPQERKFALQLF